MALPRICRRVSKLSHNKFLVFSSISSEKHFPTPNPSSISPKFRVFFSTNLVHNPGSEVSTSASIQSHNPHFGPRGSRIAITQAERQLFDYLHFNRNLRFSDAEHMSKNSPLFIQKLLSKIDNDENVGHSLGKFLRYNPINEFEPFFESLGLRPSQISSLLPRHLIFLSDDPLLLENFYVLCNYGIPRSKIGKIYVEAREIFSFKLESLSLKLYGYEKLGVSKATVVKLVIGCPSLLISDVDEDFVHVLAKLNKLGMENDQLEEYFSWKVSSNEFLFNKNPLLFLEASVKGVCVLLSSLLKLGIDRNEVYSLFVNNPDLLSAKCAKNVLRALEIFVYIGLETTEIADIVCKHMEVLCLCPLKGGKTVCTELKIKKVALRAIVRQDPLKFFSIASKKQLKSSEPKLSRDFHGIRMQRAAFLLRLGYVENSEEMMRASKKFQGRADQLQERFDCLVEAGLDSQTVSSMIKQVPMALTQSKALIQKKIDCLKSCYPITSLITFPAYLCYDIERVNQRFAMYVWLRDRGVINKDYSLGTILAGSNARFVKTFVDLHPDGPVVWERLRNTSS